jgi:hypothetical protein
VVRKSLPVVLVVGGTLALASVGIANRDQSVPLGIDAQQVESIEPKAMDGMSVLRTSRKAADALPNDIAAKVDEHADFGMNPHLSRLSIANTVNSLYIVPARDHICASLTVGEGANFNCRSADDLAAGKSGPATVIVEGGGIGIYGVVPDGVDSVYVQTGQSEQIRVDVERNAYFTVMPAGTPIRAMSYVGPSGPVEFDIYDPARAFDEQGD